MKTLFISDLDGTLLNPDAELSDFTAGVINGLHEKGIYFSIATARTDASVKKIMEGVKLGAPAVLMNGAALFDLEEGRYISSIPIGENGKKALMEALGLLGYKGFLYTIEDGRLNTLYENVNAANAEAFIAERVRKYGKQFTRVESLLGCDKMNAVHFSVSGQREQLLPVQSRLLQSEEVNVEFYEDRYNPSFWYLEVMGKHCSKYHGVQALKKLCGFERVISFGDN